MTFSTYTEKSVPIFKSLKILNIFELNTYLIAVFMYSYHRSFLDNLLIIIVYIPTIRDQLRTYILNFEKQMMANIL